MSIKPLLDRVVVKMLEAEETQIIAVGPGGVVEGHEEKMYVEVGQKVLVSKYAGTQVKVDGEEYTILRQSDLLAIVE